jgi:hypothetical protein
MSFSEFRDVDSIVLGVREHSTNVDAAEIVSHIGDDPILVATDIEHYAWTANYIRSREDSQQVMVIGPT